MSSRVAKKPILIPKGVDVVVSSSEFTVKGKHGSLTSKLHKQVKVVVENDKLFIKSNVNESSLKSSDQYGESLTGTTRAIINNMVHGVSNQFIQKLILKGVGYKASVNGDVLLLNLGYSHPIEYKIPRGLTITTPSQTEIVISGVDKCLVGQSASDIRSYRPPEPYKGKGIRYENEIVHIKETKK